jgi:hypothetical protein
MVVQINIGEFGPSLMRRFLMRFFNKHSAYKKKGYRHLLPAKTTRSDGIQG